MHLTDFEADNGAIKANCSWTFREQENDGIYEYPTYCTRRLNRRDFSPNYNDNNEEHQQKNSLACPTTYLPNLLENKQFEKREKEGNVTN